VANGNGRWNVVALVGAGVALFAVSVTLTLTTTAGWINKTDNALQGQAARLRAVEQAVTGTETWQTNTTRRLDDIRDELRELRREVTTTSCARTPADPSITARPASSP